VLVDEIAARLEAGEADKVVIADVRSHGYYDAEASRIRGSIRLEPNLVLTALHELPNNKDIYLYCT
jgi:rhodanese-related sulfurtransferase